MYFFVAQLLSIAVMTYTNVRHLRPMNRRFITHTANIFQLCNVPASVTAAHRPTRDPTVVWCLLYIENPCEYTHKLYIARNWIPKTTWQMLYYGFVCIWFYRAMHVVLAQYCCRKSFVRVQAIHSLSALRFSFLRVSGSNPLQSWQPY